MGYTLDQLLDVTGVSELSGGSLKKQAAAKSQGPDLQKLAERCRRAAEATPEEVVSSNQQELVEKTAAVAIIGRTLSELREIEDSSPGSVKVAAQFGSKEAAFIKAALDAGHSPHEVAEFLEKQAVFGRVGRRAREFVATKRFGRAGQKLEKAQAYSSKNIREWQDVLRRAEGASEAEKMAILSRMRRNLGDDSSLNLLTSMPNTSFKKVPGFDDLKKSVPMQAAQAGEKATKNYAVSGTIGGSEVGLTSKQLNAMKKPALYAGAGYMGHRALSGGGDKQKSGRGPVIITG